MPICNETPYTYSVTKLPTHIITTILPRLMQTAETEAVYEALANYNLDYQI